MVPSEEILKNYADVLVKFALWGGKGIKKGETVCLQVPECAKPILEPLQVSVLEAGGYPIIRFLPDCMSRSFFEHANENQLTFMPKKYMLSRIDVCTHFVSIIAEADKYELKGIDGKKIMARSKAAKFYKDAFMAKTDADKSSWTLALYGTEAMANDVNMSLDEYWDEIIKACFLDYKDPISKWRKTNEKLEEIRSKLNALKIESAHVVGDDVDLHVQLGSDREWLGGRGCNIPSFELFISPDWRGTEGWIRFSEPLYRFGNLIKGVELRFEEGRVVEASATENEQLLKDMIEVENADKVGEFSLTDRRFSRITKFMGETLFDEKVGGEFGNTHIALGSAYRESYPGNASELKEKDWKKLGYNDSVIHTDIVSTTNRTVTAKLADGSNKVIYEDGKFQV